jgi:anti-sigma B factor antagonist
MFSHDPPLAVNVVHEDGSLVVALAGELDIATRPILQEAVAKLLSPHLKAVTLDLTGVTFVDVVGLRAILEVKEMVVGVQADFRLKSVTDFTRRLIRVVDFDGLETAVEAPAIPSEA